MILVVVSKSLDYILSGCEGRRNQHVPSVLRVANSRKVLRWSLGLMLVLTAAHIVVDWGCVVLRLIPVIHSFLPIRVLMIRATRVLVLLIVPLVPCHSLRGALTAASWLLVPPVVISVATEILPTRIGPASEGVDWVLRAVDS